VKRCEPKLGLTLVTRESDFPITQEEKKMVQWNTDADAALARAKELKKPLLVDFSAAPA
jgi:uncharacterized protein YyaL (SSP411 family)